MARDSPPSRDAPPRGHQGANPELCARAPNSPAPPLGTWSAARAQPPGTNYPPHHAPRSCSCSARTAPFRTATCVVCVCVCGVCVCACVCVCVRARRGVGGGGGRTNLPGDLFSSPIARCHRAPVPTYRPPKYTNFAHRLPWTFPPRGPHLFECTGCWRDNHTL